MVDSPFPVNTYEIYILSGYLPHIYVSQKVGSVGPVVKGNLGKVAKITNNELLMRFDEKYRLYRNIDGGISMTEAFERGNHGSLIVYENSQMLQYRMRRDYTNK